MKKLCMCSVAMLLGLSMVACDDETVTNSNEVETVIEETVEVEETQEEIIEEEVIEEPEEEVEEVVEEPEEPIDTFDYDELHYYLTTNLTDSEYQAYFDDISIDEKTSTIREIEFDAHIIFVTPSEKYSTRCELMMASGDYNNGEFTGPYIKTRDIAYTSLNGAHEGSNVRVKATIENYDMTGGYLKLNIKEISVR